MAESTASAAARFPPRISSRETLRQRRTDCSGHGGPLKFPQENFHNRLPAGGLREVHGVVLSVRAAVGRTCGERGLISRPRLDRKLGHSS